MLLEWMQENLFLLLECEETHGLLPTKMEAILNLEKALCAL